MTVKRYYIGGSDAAAACGLDPWRSPVQLWLEKTGQLEPRDETEAMQWGTRLQPILAEWVAETTEYAVSGPVTPAYVHSKHPWMIGHIDGLVCANAADLGVLEIKTAGLRQAAGWDDEQIPLAYQVQGQHYLAVTGLSYVIYGALLNGNQFVIRRMERDDQVIGLIIEREAELWRKITTGEAPAPTAQDTELLKLLYPSATGRKIVTLDHLPDVRHRYRMAKDGLKAAETALAAVENEIKGVMADAELATVDGLPAFRWPTVLAHRLDAAALKEECPDLYANYYRDTQHRRFTEARP